MFFIRIANYDFVIDNKYDYIYHLCKNYITHATSGIEISVTHDEINREQTGEYKLDYLESLAIYRKIAEYLIDKGIVLFHGSAIAVDNEAYIFTAKSGTGKSTHVKLWCELFKDQACVINDDKPLLSVKENSVIVHGTPWSGKHHLDSNISVPLKAICILERGISNRIERINDKDAWPILMQHSYRPCNESSMEKTLSLIDILIKNTKFYKMYCNMDIQAALMAYNCMGKKRGDK